MACGTPVIVSNTTSLPEVVGDAGLYVDPLDVDSIASAIDKIISDEVLQETLRQKGLAQAKMFSWEKTAVLTMQALMDAAEGN
jgi:glycosyltransferase involved in cell wall biosynthesis